MRSGDLPTIFPTSSRRFPERVDVVKELYDDNMRTMDRISAIAGESQASARELATNSMRMGDQLAGCAATCSAPATRSQGPGR